MAYYRCGGANHYDEGYSAGYSAGYAKGKIDGDVKHNCYIFVEAFADGDTHSVNGTAILYVDGVEKLRAKTETFWPSGGPNWRNKTSSTIQV